MRPRFEVALTKGKVAVVDACDYERVIAYRWYALERDGLWHAAWRGGPRNRRRSLYMHRLILGVNDPRVIVDHANGDGLDNRRCNIRVATKAQNAMNMRLHRDSSTRLKGVSWQESARRWRATINAEGRQIYLGHFRDPIDAALAYDAAALRYFGIFAATNFGSTS